MIFYEVIKDTHFNTLYLIYYILMAINVLNNINTIRDLQSTHIFTIEYNSIIGNAKNTFQVLVSE